MMEETRTREKSSEERANDSKGGGPPKHSLTQNTLQRPAALADDKGILMLMSTIFST